MEHNDAGEFLGIFDTRYRQSFFIRVGVAAGGDDDVDRKAGIPFDGLLFELPIDARIKYIENIGLQEPHVHLALGVAKACIVFEHFDALRTHFEARIQESGERYPLSLKRIECRLYDAGLNVGRLRIIHKGKRADGAHAAGILALIIVQRALVVLYQREHLVCVAVGNGMHRYLRAVEKFFDDNFATRVLKDAVNHYLLERAVDLFERLAYIHSFSEREPARFYHDGCATLVRIAERFVVFCAYLEICGRDAAVPHELFGKRFRTFYLRSRFRRAPHAKVVRLEYIDYPADQRVVGTDDGETDIFFFREFRQTIEIHSFYLHALSVRERPAVPRRNIELPDTRRLLQFPRERVFAPSPADDEYVSCHCVQYTAFPPPAYRQNVPSP